VVRHVPGFRQRKPKPARSAGNGGVTARDGMFSSDDEGGGENSASGASGGSGSTGWQRACRRHNTGPGASRIAALDAGTIPTFRSPRGGAGETQGTTCLAACSIAVRVAFALLIVFAACSWYACTLPPHYGASSVCAAGTRSAAALQQGRVLLRRGLERAGVIPPTML
jgi:hypothetical protein